MSDERRDNDRIDTHDVGLRALNRVDQQPFGEIGNLSASGMMLITSHELYPGGVLQLLVEAPGLDNVGPISMGMKILWCSPASSDNEYWAGLKTIDINREDRARLEQLLDQLKTPVV